ncbi:hypothetical protein Z517_11498 [Fonsecaea pedrosoi CBS 271.37]|uniref:Uncharacterized protein n=1 Tax=Fonsecaea pedrosoi CBS 271.37 TaxID=1442368 RepID=A0A0D2G1P2_9EURO|nr:uncharacterized protein Z517_11498 [Fonsecaea pedrosoi CBS 271.37]KIW74728.1 hypothetical protein Z517_11498 [Fonsecaea pedrosoi CBS 271.37]
MCKIIRYRYTKCWRPADAGEDYDEHDPKNLCDGGVDSQKIPCFTDVCDQHEDGIPRYQYVFGGFLNEPPKCNPTVEICYIPTHCALHRQQMVCAGIPVPVDANIHTEPEAPLPDFTWHIPRVPLRDPGFRMVDWNPEPRRVPLDQPPVSPKTQATFNPEQGGVINAMYDPEHWVSADDRPIDLLENHYADPDVNDFPAFPRIKGPAMPPPGPPSTQDMQTPVPQSVQAEPQPANSQLPSQCNGSQGQPQHSNPQNEQQTLSAVTGDIPLPALLSGNMFGNWREVSKAGRSSTGLSSSESSSSSPQVPAVGWPNRDLSSTPDPESTGKSPIWEQDLLAQLQSFSGGDKSRAPQPVSRLQSPGQNANPQGQKRSDDDGEGEQIPLKRRKLNSGTPATSIAKRHDMTLRSSGAGASTARGTSTTGPTSTHRMKLRPWTPRIAPAPTPVRPNTPAAGTVTKRKTRTVARAGTRGSGISNPPGKAKSTSKPKLPPQRANKVQKEQKKQKKQETKKTTTQTQRPARKQVRGRGTAPQQAATSTTPLSTSTTGPMTRSRRAAQGAQLNPGMD